MKRWENVSFAIRSDLLMRRTSHLDLKNANEPLHFMNWLTEKKKWQEKSRCSKVPQITEK